MNQMPLPAEEQSAAIVANAAQQPLLDAALELYRDARKNVANYFK
jgi:hypothetical protein